MQTYRLKPEAFARIRKQLIYALLPVYLIMFSILAFLLYGHAASNSMAVGLVVVFLVMVVGYSAINNLRRQKKAWESFQLTITQEYIAREQELHTPLRIAKEDIIAIEENDKVYHVCTSSKFNSIIISKEIDNKEEVELLLKGFMPITPSTKGKNWQPLIWGTLALSALLFYVCMSGSNPLISLLAGLVLLGGLSYGLFVTLKAKQLEVRVRRMAWVGIIPLLVVALKVLDAATALLP